MFSRPILALTALLALPALAGCVAVPVEGDYGYVPAPVYAPPVYAPPVVIAPSYRPYHPYGYRPWRGGWR